MKKFKILSTMVAFTFIVWILYSTPWATRTSKLLPPNQYFIRKTLLNPVNTTCQNAPFIIIIVTSYVGHVKLRNAHRRAMNTEHLQRFNAERAFLLAAIPKSEKNIKQESIEDESRAFGDLLQGTFEEHYRNLTYKNLMGLEWASTKCSNAKYILKVDDDTVFNLEATYKYLKDKNADEKFLIGHIWAKALPEREKQAKYYVSEQEYPRNSYPPYLSGVYYVTTPIVAGRLVDEAIFEDHAYFWIDDIFITGILRVALKIKIKPLPRHFWLKDKRILERCLRVMETKGIRCSYVVMPHGSKNNLILYKFNRALKNVTTTKIGVVPS